jgi:hypothetical protein
MLLEMVLFCSQAAADLNTTYSQALPAKSNSILQPAPAKSYGQMGHQQLMHNNAWLPHVYLHCLRLTDCSTAGMHLALASIAFH